MGHPIVHSILNLPHASQLLEMTNPLRNNFVISTGAYPDFLLRGTHQRLRVRLSVSQFFRNEILGRFRATGPGRSETRWLEGQMQG